MIGELRATGAVFHQQAWFSRFTAVGLVEFISAEFHGETRFARSDFGGEVSFQGGTFERAVDFTEARFRDDLDLRVEGGATARTHAMRVSLRHEVRLPEGWVLDTTHGPEFGLVRA